MRWQSNAVPGYFEPNVNMSNRQLGKWESEYSIDWPIAWVHFRLVPRHILELTKLLDEDRPILFDWQNHRSRKSNSQPVCLFYLLFSWLQRLFSDYCLGLEWTRVRLLNTQSLTKITPDREATWMGLGIRTWCAFCSMAMSNFDLFYFDLVYLHHDEGLHGDGKTCYQREFGICRFFICP